MIQHVVLIGFPASQTDRLETVNRLLSPFNGNIPGLARFHWGWDQSGRAREYNLALVMEFESWQDLASYQPHPIHQAFARWVADEGGQVLAFDFPI